MRYHILAVIVLVLRSANGEIVEFEEKADWVATVSNYTTIDFTGFPVFTIVTDQYEGLGVLFVDGDNFIQPSLKAYPNDGWGLDGDDFIELSFSSPKNWIGADFPGSLLIQLYLNGQFVNVAASHGPGFDGVISDQPFEAARLLPTFGSDLINIDDLFFGAQIPGDANNDGAVDVVDLTDVVLAWGMCPADQLCFTDLNHDGIIGVDDIVAVVVNWE